MTELEICVKETVFLWRDDSAEASSVESELKAKGFQVKSIFSPAKEPTFAYNGLYLGGYASLSDVFRVRPQHAGV
jgi:hypothetical protein